INLRKPSAMAVLDARLTGAQAGTAHIHSGGVFGPQQTDSVRRLSNATSAARGEVRGQGGGTLRAGSIPPALVPFWPGSRPSSPPRTPDARTVTPVRIVGSAGGA